MKFNKQKAVTKTAYVLFGLRLLFDIFLKRCLQSNNFIRSISFFYSILQKNAHSGYMVNIAELSVYMINKYGEQL